MKFLKEYLLHSNYIWPETPESVFNGLPSRRLFDRYNGEQMLFIINSYASISEAFTIEIGRQVEDILLQQLPMDARSEVSVFNWLVENFNANQIVNN